MENGNLSDESKQELNEEQVFLEMSKAVRENDYTALTALTTSEEPVVKEGEKPEEESKEVIDSEEKSGEVEDKPEVKLEEETKDERDLEIAKLREELAQKTKVEHQLRSDAGRIPALQRKLMDIEKKLQEVTTKKTSTAAETREDAKVLSQKLAQIKEADPLLAEAVEEAIKAAFDEQARTTDTKLAETKELFSKKEEEALIEREYAKLVQAVPNAPEVFAHPLWAEWKSLLPPNLLQLAESQYADEVVLAMEQFGKFVVQRHPELAKKEEVKVEEKKVEPNVEADKVAAEREKKLKAPAIKDKVVMEKDTEEVDPQKLFEKFYAKEREQFVRAK